MTPHAYAVLRHLADAQFHSGEALGRALGLSRASVWNAIQAIRGAGLEVYSVTGRGYRLRDAINFVDTQRVLRTLGPIAAKLQIETVDEIGSTNTALAQRAPEYLLNGKQQPAICLLAEWQTQGRGRRGRTWFAGIGGALTFSVLWRFEQGAAHLSALSLAVGVALVRAFDGLGAQAVMLKWPNDIVHHHHKLAGVLIELEGDVLGPACAVIGIGINVHVADALRSKVDQAVTDLESLLGRPVDRSDAWATVLRHLEIVLERYAEEGFAPFKDEWVSRHVYQQRDVWLLLPGGERVGGRVDGVADDGSLLLTTGSGQKRYTVGEISVRATKQ